MIKSSLFGIELFGFHNKALVKISVQKIYFMFEYPVEKTDGYFISVLASSY